MTAQPHPSMSFEEYLELEKRTGIKHEYYRGQDHLVKMIRKEEVGGLRPSGSPFLINIDH